jgi:hypothetical protein
MSRSICDTMYNILKYDLYSKENCRLWYDSNKNKSNV